MSNHGAHRHHNRSALVQQLDEERARLKLNQEILAGLPRERRAAVLKAMDEISTLRISDQARLATALSMCGEESIAMEDGVSAINWKARHARRS